MTIAIPYGRQDISQDDIDEVVAVLRSDFLTQGPVVPSFENSVAQFCGAKYAVAVNSATSALHIACLALGVGEGDIVWTTPITFVASANCALYCGAEIDFIDIDPFTYNLNASLLADKLAEAEKIGQLPKVLIPVHLCGQSCDMAKIYELSLKYGFKIIEDASHAIGAKYKGEPIGSGRYSDITVFSFHPVKIITTGEGGMATTNSESLAKRMQLFRSHGIRALSDKAHHLNNEIWNYEQIELGFNYRMTDLQAALGLSQMDRLNYFVECRNNIASRYDEALVDLPLITPWQHQDSNSSYHLYPIRIKAPFGEKNQREIYDELRRSGIGVNLHYIPVYRQPFYASRGFFAGYCPEAENYYHQAISLPIFPALSHEDQDYVIDAVKKATVI
ncbi:UDP-4-amino-4,6-dideoxy-N-acetyl-beta-L-altrosamine transaminase [Polynucleobacter alcilacus]|uniref:UDP-4-amino-4, 6-dideoxy-N-acetyl-beta-L-altrosamine transaminase n=1 Tax=Polynucleobacter alcilacus TaxID=1819739 RepID=UPI001C0E7831|nr:UDP-4-amino-4,6-dideoxy-N-acetyl-beta-L-altrosamine transaminase [Polynucleobacter alcilacus]MBU3568169.1 UDP-4-amino-4,6-dideoxy-N-acetyl-beta-L-altrosamine transaminase [Polynucleobacter alcilacus]